MPTIPLFRCGRSARGQDKRMFLRRTSELGFWQRNGARHWYMYLLPSSHNILVAAVHFWEGEGRDLIITPDSNPLALCGEAEELWVLHPWAAWVAQKVTIGRPRLRYPPDMSNLLDDACLHDFSRSTTRVPESLYTPTTLSAKRPSPYRHMASGIDERTKF